MKFVSFITLILFFSLSCQKEKTPKKTEQFLSLIGKNMIISSWNFNDLTTNENYNLLNNNEIDKIYIAFLNGKLLIIYEDIEMGNSYFGWRVWEYELDIENDRIILKPDILTNYEITKVDEKNLEFNGFHELHLQQQEIDIEMSVVTNLPPKVTYLIQQYM